MNTPTLCIYHAHCVDGFTAAWIVWKKFGDAVRFVPASYGEAPPYVTGQHVIIVDFSYKRDVMEKLIEECASIVVLDHHKTAREELIGFPVEGRCKVLFDMERSGAMMTWNYLFPDVKAPKLVEYVQDRDLWKFEIEGTREAYAYCSSYKMDFLVWDGNRVWLQSDNLRDGAINEGRAILRAAHKQMAEVLASTRRHMIIGGIRVPVANVPYSMASDAGHLLGEDAPFAATYVDTAAGRVFSLRSAPEGSDVSAIAKIYGGGGHTHAAGFKMELGWEGDKEETVLTEDIVARAFLGQA